ncbi:unnamed protein product [Merluccius merluccius]
MKRPFSNANLVVHTPGQVVVEMHQLASLLTTIKKQKKKKQQQKKKKKKKKKKACSYLRLRTALEKFIPRVVMLRECNSNGPNVSSTN